MDHRVCQLVINDVAVVRVIEHGTLAEPQGSSALREHRREERALRREERALERRERQLGIAHHLVIQRGEALRDAQVGHPHERRAAVYVERRIPRPEQVVGSIHVVEHRHLGERILRTVVAGRLDHVVAVRVRRGGLEQIAHVDIERRARIGDLLHALAIDADHRLDEVVRGRGGALANRQRHLDEIGGLDGVRGEDPRGVELDDRVVDKEDVASLRVDHRDRLVRHARDRAGERDALRAKHAPFEDGARRRSGRGAEREHDQRRRGERRQQEATHTETPLGP